MKENLELTNLRPGFRQFKKQINENLETLGATHTDCFNEMLSHGLMDSAASMTPLYFDLPSGDKIKIQVESIDISSPSVPPDVLGTKNKKVYPVECRQAAKTYQGMCTVKLGWSVNGLQKPAVEAELGEVPIMIKSAACNLHGLTPEQLVSHGEHENEWGGYFIVKGHEKIIRMLLMTRRNYPIAVKRSVWKDRGALFSDLGIMVRTARKDETCFNNVLHYLNNGNAKLMFSQRKMLSYVPVCLILKALTNKTDEKIYADLVRGYESDQYYAQCVQNMMREVHEEGIHTQIGCKHYIGGLFRSQYPELPAWAENFEICDYILNERIMIHLDTHDDKYNFLIFMVQKLFQCAQGRAKVENVDGVMMQEVLLGGHLYQKVLTERIEIWLNILKRSILKKCSDGAASLTAPLLTTCIRQSGGVSRSLESFLATGNVSTQSGLGLMQTSGLVVMAENINRMRYMSHFRAVHRGSYFTTMRTTEARQLLPDAWGFICPVHTPDGTPCGLLNHLTVNCKIAGSPDEKLVARIPELLTELGMTPVGSCKTFKHEEVCSVLLEGCVLGYIHINNGTKIVDKLRYLKVNGELPEMLEIVFIPYEDKGQYPGLFLFVGAARMMRPVKNLLLDKVEYIGTFEQVYMNIAIDHKEIYPNVTTHMELSKTAFLSNLANLIPMPDCNQSPRNMYQCQMGKQTMGTPCHNFSLQSETKLYRLQTPATPLFRPLHYNSIELDDFAMGTNAIVAVISYTGYDMEDAMIINRAAHDRGFAYGSIYKSQFVELRGTSYFARNPNEPELAKYIDNDGLPAPGTKLTHRCVLYCYYDTDDSTYHVVKNDEKEEAIVDNVRYCGGFDLKTPKKICITIRVPRKANIGDKFASRAGQKGICSQRYPAEDLPFTESGLIPDIVFNPHGFPSRMTIAMMIEAMAGKSGAIHGLAHDATPFRFSEKNTAIDYFGKMLQSSGYNYYGTERMYSGVDGREIIADVFFGVVHYQRLRHMVFDKWQVRSTGPVDAITQQPIKGRKRGGGVRFGEMERDALISHGSAFLLQDRLFCNSDKVTTLVCIKCGTLIGPIRQVMKRSDSGLVSTPSTCKLCHENANIGFIEVPYAFKYLVTELASVNINANFKLSTI